MQPGHIIRQRALEILEGEPSKNVLAEFVRWLDLEMHNEEDEYGPAYEVYLLALIALGDLVLGICPPTARLRVQATIAAAEAALSSPDEPHYDALFAAATESYPFGPGEGCYAIEATGVAGCDPGSGCRTGAGALACQALPEAELLQHLRNELRPWLAASGQRH